MASRREGGSKSGINLEAKGGIIFIFDEEAKAFLALFKELFEAGAAINGGGFGITTNVWKTSGESYHLVCTFGFVLIHIGACKSNQHEH